MYGFGTPAKRPVERHSIDHVSRRSGSLAFSFDREHSPGARNLDQSVPALGRHGFRQALALLRIVTVMFCVLHPALHVEVPGRNWMLGTLVSAPRADLRSP